MNLKKGPFNFLWSLLLLPVLFFNASAQKPSIKGKTLHCCTLQQPPSVLEEPLRKTFNGMGGLAFDLLAELQNELDFKCHSVEDFTGRRGFSSFVFSMESCTNGSATLETDPVCSCDIGVGGWMQTDARIGRVDFLPPLIHDYMQTTVNVDYTFLDENNTFFLTAFGPWVWVAIFGLFLFFTVLKLLDRRFVPCPDPHHAKLSISETPLSPLDRLKRLRQWLLKQPLLYRSRKAFQSVSGRFLAQVETGIEGDARTLRQWILNMSIFLVGLFLVLSYEATMTANLVLGSTESSFKSIKDFQHCHIPASDVCLTGGGASAKFWENAVASERKSCNGENKSDVPDYSENSNESIKKVANSSHPCKYLFSDGTTSSFAVNGMYCRKLVKTGKTSFPNRQGFILPKGSPWTDELSTEVLKLAMRDKLLSLDEYYEREGECIIHPATSSLSIRKLSLFFIMSYVTCFLLLLEMVFDPQQPVSNGGTPSVVGVINEGDVESDTKLSFHSGDVAISTFHHV